MSALTEVSMQQLSLFSVQEAYSECASCTASNAELYDLVAAKMGWPPEALDKTEPVGRAGRPHSPLKRKIRWHQQTLKRLGILERESRGKWKLAEPERGLHFVPAHMRLLGFSTKLGVALWAEATLFQDLDEPIHLCLTSPPYPLKKQRKYGNAAEKDWIQFICKTLQPIVRNLVLGASLVLNVSNDIFLARSPARSLYLERLVLTLHDALGLELMDRIPWINDSKPPGPTPWACVKRYQLAVSWEPILWFSNCPESVRSDNRRVLRPHSEKQRKLIAKGGEQRSRSFGDGAYSLRPGSFSAETPGSIPKNNLRIAHNCTDSRAIRKEAKRRNLPSHGAMFPTALADFFIRFLTEENELVVDPFAGAFKTCLAAERLGRRWIGTERVLEYVEQARDVPGAYSLEY